MWIPSAIWVSSTIQMSISVLVLKFRESEEGDLDQRMNDAYISAFAPQIANLQRLYRFNNSYIIPVENLLEDQIALLKSRGAFPSYADVLKAMSTTPVPRSGQTIHQHHPIPLATAFNHVCVFRQYVVDHQGWLEAYTVLQA
jgi:hypothetical protein